MALFSTGRVFIMSIILYGRHTSYNVQKILWFADEIGLNYEHIELGFEPGDTETVEFGRLNPMRKVPVLVDNEKSIWESNTILRYLARRYANEQWLPGDAFGLSLVERWMDWAQTRLEPAFVDVFWGYYRTPEAERDFIRINRGIVACRFCLDRIDEQLDEKDFLLGDNPSLADIAVGVFIYRLDNIGLDIELSSNLRAWFHRLGRSKAYRRWVMSDFSSLKGRLQY